MDLNLQDQAQCDSDVSCFTLDGVVAEMVIEVDEENESSQKTLKLNDFEKFKAVNSPSCKSSLENVCSNFLPESNEDLKSDDAIAVLKNSDEMQTDSASVSNAVILVDGNLTQSMDANETTECSTARVPLAKSENNLKESIEDSIYSDLDQIRRTMKLFDKSKDEDSNAVKLFEESNEEPSKLTNSPKPETVSSPKSFHGRKIKATKKALDAMKQSGRLQKKNAGKKINSEVVTTTKSSSKKKTLNQQENIEKDVPEQKESLQNSMPTVHSTKKKTLNQQENKDKNLPEQKESLQNIMPTALSTRGNKRKLKDIEQGDIIQKSSLKTAKLANSERLNAAASLTLLKPKSFNLFADGSTMESFLHFKTSFIKADLKYQRHLYRVLFDKWAPNDANQMREDVFQFKRFPFNKNSEELEKRRHILKKLPDSSVEEIYKMFDLEEGKKDNQISTILNFLLKPTKIIISIVDPFHSSMQPIVKMEKLSFGDTYLISSEKEKKPDTIIKRPRGRPAGKSKSFIKESSTSEDNKKPISENDVTTPKSTRRKSTLKIESSDVNSKELIKTEIKSIPVSTKRKGTVKLKIPSSQKKNTSSSIQEITSSSETSLLVSSEEKLLGNDEINESVSSDKESSISKRKLSTNDTESPVKKEKLSVGSQKEIKGGRRKYASKNIAVKGDNKIISVVIPKKKESLDKNIELSDTSSEKTVKVKKKSENLSVTLHKKAMKNKIKDLKKEIVNLRKKVSAATVKSKGEGENISIVPTLENSVITKGLEDIACSEDLSIAPEILLNTKEDKSEDDSSEVTLSADEIEETSNDSAKKKKLIRCGKPLRTFKNIRDSIMNGSFSALQRLHIVLFGASDKAENLKANILAFGGFPFLEGSDQWKQKEFLLSLLALNTLKEYLNLLCIDYSDEDDQQKLISKLMKFLAAPNGAMEILLDEEKCLDIKTKVVHSELVQFPLTKSNAAKRKKSVKEERKSVKIDQKIPSKVEEKKSSKVEEKKSSKVEEKKTRKVEEKNSKVDKSKGAGNKNRKVLMDEAQVRRLEADIAREQRILEREKRYNAEMQKKYKQSQDKPSSKNEILSPEAIENMKIPPTTAMLVKQTDTKQLNALLQTVYKRRALKAAGAVISTPNKGSRTKLGELPNVKFLVVTANYSDLDVLHHLIYMTDAVKAKVRKNILDFSGFGFNEDSSLYKDRMDFLNSLGYDISKRIAFLLGLCPFKTDIAQLDLNELIMYFLMSPCKTKQVPITHLPQTFFSKSMPEELCQLLQKHSDIEVSAVSPTKAKAAETQVTSKPNELVMKKVTESITKSGSREASPTKSITPTQKAKKSFKSSCLPPVKKLTLSPSISTIPFKSAKPVQKPKTKGLPKMNSNNSAVQSLQKAILQTVPFNQASTAPQEFMVQQQTPDGQKKTYKLIKLPTNHPLNSVLKPQSQISSIPPIIQTQPVSFSSSLSTLPPGIIIFKNSNDPPITVPSVMPNVLQNIPIVLGQTPTNTVTPVILPQSSTSVLPSKKEEFVLPEDNEVKLPVECEYSDDEVEVLNPLKEEPPTDDELYSSIQEVIHNANFEDITLRNVIDRVSAKYSNFDLTHRHAFMKECVKKIIIGS